MAADPPDNPVVLEPQVFAFSVTMKFLKVPFSNSNGAKVTSYKVVRCRSDKHDECVTYTSLEHHFVDKGNALEHTDEKNVAIPLLANTGYSYKISAKNKAGYSFSLGWCSWDTYTLHILVGGYCSQLHDPMLT